MLYHLFEWFDQQQINFPGSELYKFITFRVVLAVLMALAITMIYGRKLINFLKKKQIGETVRDLGLAGEQSKKGTPTMGGLIIILAILIPTLLFANLNKVYIRLMLVPILNRVQIQIFLKPPVNNKARRVRLRELLFEARRQKKSPLCVQSSLVFAEKLYHYQGIESNLH